MAEHQQEYCSICDLPYETIGPSPARGHDCIISLLKENARLAAERTLATVQAEHAELDASQGRIERLEEVASIARGIIDEVKAAQTIEGDHVRGTPFRHWASVSVFLVPLEEALAAATSPTGQTPAGGKHSEPVAICAICGHTLQLVRPGQYQCDYCEREEPGNTGNAAWERWVESQEGGG